jgi:hypothetical protein
LFLQQICDWLLDITFFWLLSSIYSNPLMVEVIALSNSEGQQAISVP